MLIKCHRHTQADLEFWSELELGDKEIGRGMSSMAEKAIERMRAFADAGPCYVSTSWGKDSTVISHLLVMSGLNLPLVHISQEGPQKDPYIADVRDAFLSRFNVDYREIVVEPQEKEQRDGGHAPALDIGIKRAVEMFDTRRYIGGIRASESGPRKIALRRQHGNTCHPIAWWNDSHVFGWLAWNDLPVHPNYAMTGNGRWERGRIRVSIIGGKKGAQFGRREWETEYYGDMIRRLESTVGR